MQHSLETRRFSTLQPQGSLFSHTLLPRQPRAYKGELEEEFLPPRDRRSMQ